MSRRIDNITNRIVSLAAKQPAPRLVLILDDGSKRNVFGGLPESLVHLQLPDGCCVASIEKPTGMDDLSAALYDWFEDIATGQATLDKPTRPDIVPEKPAEPVQWPERNHNLI
nr:MAG TPA: hypothetical protein [Bacteriophage sp.]